MHWDLGESVTQGCFKNTEALENLGCDVEAFPWCSIFWCVNFNKLVCFSVFRYSYTDKINWSWYGDHVLLEKKKDLEAEVEFLLKNGLAEPSYSSILVRKANSSHRFWIDYRKVNSQTKPDFFPLPQIEDCIDQVGSAIYVSKFDLLKGYWQVPLTARAQ